MKGIDDLGENSDVFRDPTKKDFRHHPKLPDGVGVSPEILDRMFVMADDYGVTVEESGWRHDHIRSIEVIATS